MSDPRYVLSRQFKKARRASTSLSYSLTTWGDIDTALDIVIPARVGNDIEVGANGMWDNESVTGVMDVVTIVSSTPVNSFGTQGAISSASDGIMAWYGNPVTYTPIGGGALYTVQSGDIVSGNVTLRLRRRNLSAAAKTLLATANDPFQWWARNIGPADPN